MKACNLWMVVLETSVAFSVHADPWDSAGFYGTIRKCASDFFASADQTNDLFGSLFEDLCKDFGEGGAEFSGGEHMKSVWGQCAQRHSQLGKGLKLKLSRWMSYWDRCDEFLPQWHLVLMGLMTVGLDRGWLKSVHEIPMFGGSVDGLPQEEAQEVVADAGTPSAPQGQHVLAHPASSSAAEELPKRVKDSSRSVDGRCSSAVL